MGGLGKSILASQLSFLLAVDDEWTRAYLLPFVELSSADVQAAWDGLVTGGDLNPCVAELLKEQFLNAVTRISTDLFNQRRGFVKCYTVMFKYVADEVLDTWIPRFSLTVATKAKLLLKNVDFFLETIIQRRKSLHWR